MSSVEQSNITSFTACSLSSRVENFLPDTISFQSQNKDILSLSLSSTASLAPVSSTCGGSVSGSQQQQISPTFQKRFPHTNTVMQKD